MDDSYSLEIYLCEIKKIPLLSREEERYHIQRSKAGDIEAREKLIKGNLRLVVKMALRYKEFSRSKGISLDDLINEGNLGLIKAIEKYDIKKGVRFSTYAYDCINTKIGRMVDRSRVVQLCNFTKWRLERLLEEINELKNRGITPSIQLLANNLGMKPDYIRRLIEFYKHKYYKRTFSLTQTSKNGYREWFINHIQDPLQDPYNEVENKMLVEDVNKALSKLSEREAQVIGYRFGLNGYAKKALKEIGEMFGVSKQYIHIVEKRALKKLRLNDSHGNILRAYFK